jgi:hypothetical protein
MILTGGAESGSASFNWTHYQWWIKLRILTDSAESGSASSNWPHYQQWARLSILADSTESGSASFHCDLDSYSLQPPQISGASDLVSTVI